MHECTHTHPHIVDGLKRQDFSDHLKDASLLVFDDLTSMDLCVYCCYYCVDSSTILCALFSVVCASHLRTILYLLFVLHVFVRCSLYSGGQVGAHASCLCALICLSPCQCVFAF